jgi:hypothetical protein
VAEYSKYGGWFGIVSSEEAVNFKYGGRYGIVSSEEMVTGKLGEQSKSHKGAASRQLANGLVDGRRHQWSRVTAEDKRSWSGKRRLGEQLISHGCMRTMMCCRHVWIVAIENSLVATSNN